MTSGPTGGSGGPSADPWRRLRRHVVVAVAGAMALYVGLGVYGDAHSLTELLEDFPWRTYPVVLALTLGNYAGRLVKWRWYLGLVGVDIGARDASRVFGAGMTMVLTPGKAGELLKSYMVKNVTGTPMRVTAPVVLAERLTDGLAMLLLASVGDPHLLRLAAVVLGAMAAAVIVVQVRPLALRLLGVGSRMPVVGRHVAGLSAFYESSYVLLRPRALAVAVGIGVVSWSLEGLAYYLILAGLGSPEAFETVMAAVFIFSISAILGAVVATPGGLGGTEAGLVGLSQRILGLGRDSATAAALVARFATLWFGVAIGLAALAAWPDLLDGGDAVHGGIAGGQAS
ncbi:MAG: YbhN family protein [Anaerolineae bacterium]